MLTVKDKVFEFFENNQKFLIENYPGLSQNRLLDDFCFKYDVESDDYILNEGRDFFADVLNAVPLQYITQNSFFYRSRFFVNQSVLLPRSETEILVENSINFINNLKDKSDIKIAEIGVGSFCLGLSVLIDLEKNVTFYGSDICEKALEVAAINQFRLTNKLNPKHNINLIKGDRSFHFTEKFDFIVSNPPYIRKGKDLKGVHSQTLNYEPHIALFLEDEKFENWFDDLFQDVSSKLYTHGAFYMEGHEDTLKDIKNIALKYFSNVEIIKDYTQRDRFLHCYK